MTFVTAIRKQRYDNTFPRLVIKLSLSKWKGGSQVRLFRFQSFLLCSNKNDRKIITYHLILLMKAAKTKEKNQTAKCNFFSCIIAVFNNSK